MERSSEPDGQTIEHAFRGYGFPVHAMVDQAVALAEKGQIQTAETLLDGLVAALTTVGGKEESLARTYFALGRVLTKCDRHLDAAAAFKRAHELYDDRDLSMCWPCAANRALALARAEVDPEDIRREFGKELEVRLDQVESDPASALPSALLSLGVLNFAAGLNSQAKAFWEKAKDKAAAQEKQANQENQMEQAKKAKQEQAFAAINLASLHIAANKLEDAERDIESARSYWSDVASTTTFGITEADLAIKRENWEEAQAQLAMVLQAEPDRARALYRMGVVAALRKDYDEAEKWLRRTISVAPWHAKAQADLGRVQLARDGGTRSDGLLRLHLRWRFPIFALIAAVGLGIMLFTGWCQPDQVETTKTWNMAATATSHPASAEASETPGGPGAAQVPIAAATPVGTTEVIRGAVAAVELTPPAPSQVTQTRKELGFQDIPTGFVTIGTLIIAIAAIVLFLPAVTSIKAAGIEVTPIQAPSARPFFTELKLGWDVDSETGRMQRQGSGD